MPVVRPISAAVAIAACLTAGIGAAPGAAADQLLTVRSASVGFAGEYKAGYWNPVRVTLVAGPEGAEGKLAVVIPDGDRVPVFYADERAEQIELSAGQETTVLLYGKTGPVNAPITLELRSDEPRSDKGRTLWSQDLSSFVLPPRLSTQELIVSVGPNVGLEQAVATIRRPAESSFVPALVKSVAELPDRWWGYDGVNALVLPTSDAAVLDALSDKQRAAIIRWVELGGRLVLSIGNRGVEVLAPNSPWAALVPGRFEKVSPLRERAGLEAFARAELPYETESFQRNRPLVTRLADLRGEMLIDETDTGAGQPLMVRGPFGLGEVTFIGFDLDHPSLADWKGGPRVLASAVERGRERSERSEGEVRRAVNYLGYDDLVGQLRAALDQFPGVTMVTFTTVSILTIGYLLLIGPVDWLVLSRFGWPRQLTWLTFPLVAAGVGVAAWAMGHRSHGSATRLNQVEIVDIDVDRGLARGTVWAHLYSPATAHYDAQLDVGETAFNESAGWLAWQGLPGDALGGLASRQVVLASPQPYGVSLPGDRPAVEAMPVQVASSKSLSGRWWAGASLDVRADLALDPYGQLAGEFRQPLAVELTDCLMACGEKLYRLGTLEPGQTVTVDPQASLNLEWRLTERRVERSQEVADRWQADSTDVPRIAQMLMFHDAARGRSYTGLNHHYQQDIDLSEHIRLGRAVLVGRARTPVATLMHDDQPLVASDQARTWTWYRIVFPVKPYATPSSAGQQP